MGVGLLNSLIPLLIFPRQEGCGRNGVFARTLTLFRFEKNWKRRPWKALSGLRNAQDKPGHCRRWNAPSRDAHNKAWPCANLRTCEPCWPRWLPFGHQINRMSPRSNGAPGIPQQTSLSSPWSLDKFGSWKVLSVTPSQPQNGKVW